MLFILLDPPNNVESALIDLFGCLLFKSWQKAWVLYLSKFASPGSECLIHSQKKDINHQMADLESAWLKTNAPSPQGTDVILYINIVINFLNFIWQMMFYPCLFAVFVPK